jgi:hypothetical protein
MTNTVPQEKEPKMIVKDMKFKCHFPRMGPELDGFVLGKVSILFEDLLRKDRRLRYAIQSELPGFVIVIKECDMSLSTKELIEYEVYLGAQRTLGKTDIADGGVKLMIGGMRRGVAMAISPKLKKLDLDHEKPIGVLDAFMTGLYGTLLYTNIGDIRFSNVEEHVAKLRFVYELNQLTSAATRLRRKE